MELNVNDLHERITNAEENLAFCEQKYQQILQDASVNKKDKEEADSTFFDVDTEVIFNKMYADSLENLKLFIRALFNVMKNVLMDNYQLHELKDNLELDLSGARELNNELKERVYSMQADHQRALEQLREDMMGRYYATLEENSGVSQNPNGSNISSSSQNQRNEQNRRMEEKDKRNFEKKIIDLTKTNRQISHEVEMWRRKCNVVQEKYQNIRSLLSKDKGIGVGRQSLNPSKEETDSAGNKKRTTTSMLDEINEMSNQLDSYKLKKVMSSGG